MDKKDIGKIRTTQYDLVCNGWEVGGGSIRAHKSEILRKTYEIMGYTEEETEKSVGHMLEAFDQGTPPHGGIAFGFDRLAALVAGEKSIKEVVPFPMTYRGNTSVMSAPGKLTQEQLDELGLEVVAGIPKDGGGMRDSILKLLDANHIEYNHDVHEETPTSEDSARVRGTKMEEGIKALILKGKKSKKNYQFNISSHLKVDMKKVAAIAGEPCEFEKPDIILERFGLIIGGVPPFGNILEIPTYFDNNIQDEEKASFNCGLKTESITMNTTDLIKLVKPEIVDISK